MDIPEYIRLLGVLVANRLSLELALRAFLAYHNRAHEPQVDLSRCTVGATVPVNSFTNYDTLGELVDKFNEVMERRKLPQRVDRCVVGLRDMIAHGRVASKQPGPPVTLWKFGKPSGGQVVVEACEVLDEQWLGNAVRTMFEQIELIGRASKALGYDDLMGEATLR